MSVVPSGSPPETRNTTLNMLNVQIAPSVTAGMSDGRMIGSVTRHIRCQRVAPSTSAASNTSLGTPVSAPSVTTIMNGNPSHTFVATFAVNAVENDANHEIGSMLVPKTSLSDSMMPVIAPNWRWNIPFHDSAVT